MRQIIAFLLATIALMSNPIPYLYQQRTADQNSSVNMILVVVTVGVLLVLVLAWWLWLRQLKDP